jgi:CO dehydrogenase/acetyl-CoA synthase gamma subunit (corrinoid Fe-S protein)
MPTTFSTNKDTHFNPQALVLGLRNDLIKDFLDERNLIEYLSKEFRMMEVSRVKVEFIKRDLKLLIQTPLDAERYRELVETISETGSAALSQGNEKIFYKEIEAVLKKYIYTGE